MSTHIVANSGHIAEKILLLWDPNLAKHIAENYLENRNELVAQKKVRPLNVKNV